MSIARSEDRKDTNEDRKQREEQDFSQQIGSLPSTSINPATYVFLIVGQNQTEQQRLQAGQDPGVNFIRAGGASIEAARASLGTDIRRYAVRATPNIEHSRDSEAAATFQTSATVANSSNISSDPFGRSVPNSIDPLLLRLCLAIQRSQMAPPAELPFEGIPRYRVDQASSPVPGSNPTHATMNAFLGSAPAPQRQELLLENLRNQESEQRLQIQLQAIFQALHVNHAAEVGRSQQDETLSQFVGLLAAQRLLPPSISSVALPLNQTSRPAQFAQSAYQPPWVGLMQAHNPPPFSAYNIEAGSLTDRFPPNNSSPQHISYSSNGSGGRAHGSASDQENLLGTLLAILRERTVGNTEPPTPQGEASTPAAVSSVQMDTVALPQASNHNQDETRTNANTSQIPAVTQAEAEVSQKQEQQVQDEHLFRTRRLDLQQDQIQQHPRKKWQQQHHHHLQKNKKQKLKQAPRQDRPPQQQQHWKHQDQIQHNDGNQKIEAKQRQPQASPSRNSDDNDTNEKAMMPSITVHASDRRFVPITVDSDSFILSEYQALIRQQIYLFRAVADDLESSAQGRNKSLTLGQVGIVCKHCASILTSKRQRGSMYFPAKLRGLYQAAQNMSINHFQVTCVQIPQDVKQNIIELRESKTIVHGGGKHYWARTAAEQGVKETDLGLEFE